MEEAAIEAGKELVCSLANQAPYCFKFHTYIEKLEKARNELSSIKKEIDDEASVAAQNTEKVGEHVRKDLDDAQTLIEEAEELDAKMKTKGNCLGQCPNLIGRYFLSKEANEKTLLMEQLKKKLERMANFARRQSLKYMHNPGDFFPSESADQAYGKLLEALEDGTVNRIGLHGMGGCGKTNLLKKLRSELQKSNLFDKVAYTVVTRNPVIRDIQGSIARILNLKFDPEEREPERATRLCMSIRSSKKILIILDDVWQKLEYEDIGIPSDEPDPNHKNCTVLIATRRQQVCTLMGCKEIKLDLLDDNEALTLFRKHAGIENEDLNSLTLTLAQEITTKCRGLPIAIVAIASSLKQKPQGDWDKALQKFRDREPVDIEKGVVNPYNCLESSYDNLKDDKDATNLFLLCSLFPEDSEIPVEDLIRSGTGLGIFGRHDSFEKVRSNVDSTINKLICSSMLLQGIERQSVIMHDLVRSMALIISKKEIQVIMGSGKDATPFAEVESTKDILRYLYCHNIDEFPNQLDFPKLEILFVFKDGKYSSKVSDTFFKGLKGLKVLTVIDRSLQQTSTCLLPPSVKLLINLRTLCLKGCRLDKMDFVGNLVKLMTLEFCECTIVELSYQIAELQKLKLLDVSHCKLGGNPYRVLGRCSYLQELYFFENRLSEVVSNDYNLVEFFDKEEGSSPKLQRYHLQIGSYIDDIRGNDEPRSKVLSISHLSASKPNATIKRLLQEAEILFLENIRGGCKSIIPDIIQTGGMNDLIELLLCQSDEIECVIDASKNSSRDDRVFSKLNKLRIQNVKNLGALCHGEPPSGLFETLGELQISKCSQMKGVLFEGNLKLRGLIVLELKECQSLTSVFSPAVAQSLSLLQVLRITNCNALKHIIAVEESETVSNDGLVFSKLKEVSVIECHQLEYLIPVSFATGLERLESLAIYQARMLKYVFRQSESSSSNQNMKKPKTIKLPVLKKLELVDLQNVIDIFSENHQPSWPSLHQPYFKGSPGLTRNKARTPMVDAGLEVRQSGDHSPTKQVKVEKGITTNVKELMYRTIGPARYCFSIESLTKDLRIENEKFMLRRENIEVRIRDAVRNCEEIDESVRYWLEKADELMEIVKHLEGKEAAKRRKSVLNCIWRYGIGKQMEKRKKAVMELNKSVDFYLKKKNVDFHPFSHLPAVNVSEDSKCFPSRIMADDSKCFPSRYTVYSELLEALRDDQISMVGLYGVGGCGKTTLVKEVAKEAEQDMIFDRVVFVVVTGTVNVQTIQGKIASSLDMELKGKDESERARHLHLRLTSGKRILIILDDVWKKLDLKAIGIPFGELHNGCSVLLITRSLPVCRSMGCQKTIPLSLLTDEDSWHLFQKHAGITDDISSTMKDLALQISKECKGLPVAIAAVASSLRGNSLVEWKEALRMLKAPRLIDDIDENLGVIFNCLLLSYEFLPSEQDKSLFLLCSIFPEDYEIPMEILTRYAIGLGLFGEIDSYEETRVQVRVAANKLKESCLLLEVYGKDCVIMHDLVRDIALQIAKRQFWVIFGNEEIRGVLNHEVRYLWCDKVNELPHPLESGGLELLYVDADLVMDELLLVTKMLKVLVLHHQPAWKRSVLPLSKSVEWLKTLRCLVLNGWKLGNLSFIRSFMKLESLTFQHCSFDELPREILQLTTLRLLELSACKIKKEPYQLIGRCSQLEELYFTRCHNSNWKLQGAKSAELFGKYNTLSLKRYHIEVGENFGLFDRADYSVSRGLSVQHFDISTSYPTINYLIQRAEALFLKDIKGGCKNIIPDMVRTEGLDELVELLLCNSAAIECLVDTTSSLLRATVFSNLLKLTVESMECMEYICRGQPSLDLFGRLEELHMRRCYKMHGISSAGELNLKSLKVLKLHDCPMLIFLFTRAVAQTLALLEVLKVKQCDGLKCIVVDEEEEKRDEIISLEQNSHGLEFGKLKQIVIQNCKQLEYVFGKFNLEDSSNYQNGKKAMKIIELPVLNQIRLEQLPNMLGIFPKNYNINWPTLHDFYLSDCPQLRVRAISNCTVRTEPSQQGNTTTKDATFIEKLGSLTVKDTQVESIFDLDGLPTDGGPVTSGLTLLDLCLIHELTCICKGPKHSLSLQKLEEIQIQRCGNLKFVFSTSIMRSLSNLKVLKIVNCQELEQITEDPLPNHGFQDVCFPKLLILFIYKCKNLKRLVPVTTSHEFLKLKSLVIVGASELKEVFGCQNGDEYEEVELVLPNLEHLILIELPRLVNVPQGIQLKDVEHRVVHNCPEVGLTPNRTLEQLYQKFGGEGDEDVDYGYGTHWELLRILRIIKCNKDSTPESVSHHQMDPNDQDSVQASLKSGYNQDDSSTEPTASPNLTENIDQTMKEAIENAPLEMPVVETSSTHSDLTLLPRIKGSVQESHDSELGSFTKETSVTSLCETSTQKQTVKETIGDVPVLEVPAAKTSSTDSELISPFVPLHETPSPSNTGTVEQIVQEPKNSSLKPSQNESAQELMGGQSRNETMMTDQKALEETGFHTHSNDSQNIIKGGIHQSPMSQNANVVAPRTHYRPANKRRSRRGRKRRRKEEEEERVPLQKKRRLVKTGSKTGSSDKAEERSTTGRRSESSVAPCARLPPTSPQSQAPPKTTPEVQSSSIPVRNLPIGQRTKTVAYRQKKSTRADPRRVCVTSADSENNSDNLDDDEKEESPIGWKRTALACSSPPYQTKQISPEQSKQKIPTQPAVDIAIKTVETMASAEEQDIDDPLARLESIISGISCKSVSASFETQTNRPRKKDEIDAALKYLEDLFDRELDDFYNNDAEKSKLAETLTFLEAMDEAEMTRGIMSLVLQLKDSYPVLLDQYTSAKAIEIEFNAFEKEKAEISNFTKLAQCRRQQLERKIREDEALLQSLTGRIVEMKKSLDDLSTQHQSTTHQVATAKSEKTDLQNRCEEIIPRAIELMTKLHETEPTFVQASNKVVEIRNRWNDVKSTFLSNIRRTSRD